MRNWDCSTLSHPTRHKSLTVREFHDTGYWNSSGGQSKFSLLEMLSAEPQNVDSLSSTQVAWKTGRQAILQNQLPALVLWLFGSALVLSYYFLPSVQQGLDSLGRLKLQWGWKFSAISTGLFGGILPMCIAWIFGRSHRLDTFQDLHSLAYLISNTIFWSAKGVEIDCLYRGQAILLGSGLNWQTVITKTAIDQFLYVPAFGLLNVVLFYLWRDAGYSLKTPQGLFTAPCLAPSTVPAYAPGPP